MTLDDAMDEETTVTRQDAENECRSHACDVAEMVAALGDRSEYQARDVLIWLGY